LRTTTSFIDSAISGQQELISEIQRLLQEKLSIRVESPRTNLLETGALDSVAQVHLLLHLEKHFGLRLPMENLEVDSFVSIASIAELVANCLRVQTEWPAPALTSEMDGRRGLVREIQALCADKLSIQVEADTDLLETGVFDSMTLVQFILHLEERFTFHLPMEDIEVDSFRSVTKIAELVANRTRDNSLTRRLSATR
jgi:acyl carrier protein